MSIITPTKLIEYIPKAATISTPQLEALILRAQTVIESTIGCDRPLEKQVHNQIKKLNLGSSNCYLDFLPIDVNEPITVEARIGSGHRDRTTGFTIPQGNWQTIPVDGYTLTPTTGELNLYNYLFDIRLNTFGRNFPANYMSFTEIQTSYTGGFDFTDDQDREIKNIQIHLVNVLEYMMKGFFTGEGVKMKQVDKEYKVEYFDNSSSISIGSIPSNLLAPFNKYRPNLYSF